jgi:hypothetical protein
MKVLVHGHKYELSGFEGPGGNQIIQFIQKRPAGASTKLRTIADGTTNEEVLRALIDRLQFLSKLLPSRETSIAITKCEEALMWLDKRSAERRARRVEGTRIP